MVQPSLGTIDLFRRRQIADRIRRRFSNSAVSSCLWIRTMDTYFLNVAGSLKSGIPTKRIRDPRSSREFWIGVPVKHQRMCDWMLWRALNCLLEQFLMAWADDLCQKLSRKTKGHWAYVTFIENQSIPVGTMQDTIASPTLCHDRTIGSENNVILSQLVFDVPSVLPVIFDPSDLAWEEVPGSWLGKLCSLLSRMDHPLVDFPSPCVQ